jgi:integrase
MGKAGVERFLTNLVEKRNVVEATQKQALDALVFLYRNVLEIDLGSGIAPTRTKRRRNLPTVLTQEEVGRLLDQMNGKHALMAKLLFGCGLRPVECVRLRIAESRQGSIYGFH